jgi:hypothetical protein
MILIWRRQNRKLLKAVDNIQIVAKSFIQVVPVTLITAIDRFVFSDDL